MWIRARGWSVPSNPIPNRGAAFTPEQWQALTSTGVAVHLVVVPAGHRGPSRRRGSTIHGSAWEGRDRGGDGLARVHERGSGRVHPIRRLDRMDASN